jgi:hypothetical protein
MNMYSLLVVYLVFHARLYTKQFKCIMLSVLGSEQVMLFSLLLNNQINESNRYVMRLNDWIFVLQPNDGEIYLTSDNTLQSSLKITRILF